MSTGLRRVVVVGNGIAGLTAADTLRAEGFDGELVLVGQEYHQPYSRPALSKALLRDMGDLTSHQLPEPTHGAQEILGTSATALDLDRRRIMLDDGQELGYDGLVIASGCRPRILGDPGDGELVLRTVDDALALREQVAGASSVLVVGGGPLGMEVASGALEAGCAVTLVSRGEPLVNHLGRDLAVRLVAAGVARGLRVVVTTGAAVRPGGTAPVVVTAEGDELGADVVVTAVGDLPNTEWLASSGLAAGGPLLIDERGRLRREVVAAGDAVAVPTPRGVIRLPFWHSAVDQARCAATALLRGDEAPLVGRQLPYFWTEQFGATVKAVGWFPAAGEGRVLEGDEVAGVLGWGEDGAPAAVAAWNHRIPLPKLRRLAS